MYVSDLAVRPTLSAAAMPTTRGAWQRATSKAAPPGAPNREVPLGLPDRGWIGSVQLGGGRSGSTRIAGDGLARGQASAATGGQGQAGRSASRRWPRLRAQEVDLCVASQPIPADDLELETVRLFDEPVVLAVPLGHPLAGRASVGIDELADEPFIATHQGHWQRRLLERLFAGRGLVPRIVREGDEPGAIQELIGVGFGIGLNPAFARRFALRVPVAWVDIDSRPSSGHLSTAARLMCDAIAEWDWGGGGATA
ncbi:LysR substrate-binding domain-containing protein [Streptomyces sp. NPDC057543]|uniref:LysR substrate-binding domain-containing protein n=1 Tax=Streptomyces sp. NPDC057543 TaxID=3346163 RepID=UPI0036770BDD